MSDYIAEGAIAAKTLKFVGEPVPHPYSSDPDYYYLPDPTTGEVKTGLDSVFETLSDGGQQYDLVQFWAATEARGPFLLATTDQPFRLYGMERKLEVYYKGCLRHKLYVHFGKDVSFGLPGLAFKKGTFQQTQDMHDYPKNQRPPCEDKSIFYLKWGSFTVPVILAGKCVGVLEFVMTKPTSSFPRLIDEVCKALEKAGFQSSIQIEPPTETFIPIQSQRITPSCEFDTYEKLVPYLGLPKAKAAEKVKSKQRSGKTITENTYRSAQKRAGIPVWACITNYVSSSPKIRINPIASHSASSFGALNSVLPSCSNLGISAMSWEQATTNKASPSETQINLAAYEMTTELEPKDAHLIEDSDERELRNTPIQLLPEYYVSENQHNDYNEMGYQHTQDMFIQDLVGTTINQATSVASYVPTTDMDEEFSELWELIMTPSCTPESHKINQIASGEIMNFEDIELELQDAPVNRPTYLTSNVATTEDEEIPNAAWMDIRDFDEWQIFRFC